MVFITTVGNGVTVVGFIHGVELGTAEGDITGASSGTPGDAIVVGVDLKDDTIDGSISVGVGSTGVNDETTGGAIFVGFGDTPGTIGVTVTLGFGVSESISDGALLGGLLSDDGTGTSILVGEIAGTLDATGYDEGVGDNETMVGLGVVEGDSTGHEVGHTGSAPGGGRMSGLVYTGGESSAASTFARNETQCPPVNGSTTHKFLAK